MSLDTNTTVWLTSDEAAARIGVTPTTLRTWRCRSEGREIPYMRIGRIVRYRARDVDAFIESQMHHPSNA